MIKALGIFLLVWPIVSLAVYAFTGNVWWVDASGEEGRQAMIGLVHYLSAFGGFFMTVLSD